MKKLFLILCILPALVIAKVGNDSGYIELGGGAGVTNYYYSNAGASGIIRLAGGFVLNQVVNL